MQKTATLNLRVDPSTKEEAESVLSHLGLSMSTAVDMFLKQVALTGSIPFRIALSDVPRSLDANFMSDADLREGMSTGYQELVNGQGVNAVDAFKTFREGHSYGL